MAGKTAILTLRILGDASDAVKGYKDAEKAGKEFESAVGDIKDGVQLAGAAAGVALLAGFNGAVENAQSNNKLAGQLGLDPAESERLGRINGELFAEAYGDSIETVNEASRGVIGNIDGMADANDEAVSRITAGVLNVADTFDQDLGGVTTAVGQLMRTGMAKDADEALDIITAGLQGNVRAGEDLIDKFTEYPARVERLGLDGQTATGLIAQGLDAGARSTDLVADALKEFQIRATDGSAGSAAGFEALGLDAAKATAEIAAGGEGAAAGLDTVLDRLRGMEDPVTRNAAAVALFGTQAEDLGGALFALDPSTAVEGLGQVTGAAQQLNDTVGQDQELTKFKREAISAFTDVGTQALPLLLPALDALRQFAPILGPLAIVLAVVAAGVTVMSAAAKVYAGVQAIQTAAQWANNAAWLANPVVLIVTAIIVAIGLMVAAIVVVVQHWDLIKAGATVAFAAIGEAVSPVVDWFRQLWDWVSRVASAIGNLFNGGGIGSVIDAVAGGFSRMSVAVEPEVSSAPLMMRSMMATTADTESASVMSVMSTAAASQAVGRSAAAQGSTVIQEGDTYVEVRAGVGDPNAIAKEIRKVLGAADKNTGRRRAGGGS